MAVQFTSHQPSPQNISKGNIEGKNKTPKPPFPPPTSDRFDRTSFSSIKESNSGGPQSFTASKTSSYLHNNYLIGDEDAIDDSDSGRTTPVEKRMGEMAGMLNPHSTLHGLVCPCDGFKGWKSISVGGKVASRSFGDLTKLRMRWDWDTNVKKVDKMDLDGVEETVVPKVEEGKCPAGRSPLERLPMELLGKSWYFFSIIFDRSRRSLPLQQSDDSFIPDRVAIQVNDFSSRSRDIKLLCLPLENTG
jgi:hypothetical protein